MDFEIQKKIERAIIIGTLGALEKAGWKPYEVAPDGELAEAASTLGEVLDLVYLVDYSTVRLRSSEFESWIRIQLGDGEHVVWDHGRNIDYVIRPLQDTLAERLDCTLDLTFDRSRDDSESARV